ncbi:MAG: hypothetical protein V1882_12480 [Candidatus Omnitrophota bacterium]
MRITQTFPVQHFPEVTKGEKSVFNRNSSFLLSLIYIASFAPLCLAAPNLKIESPKKQISHEENATLKVRLEWPLAEGPYEINSLEPKLENLTLESQNQSQETGETVSQTFLYTFRPVKTGTALIYPFEISYRKADAEPWAPLFIPEQKITIVRGFPFKAMLIGLSVAGAFLIAVFIGFKQWTLSQERAAAKNMLPPDPRQRVYAKAEEAIANFSSPKPKEKMVHWANQLRTVVMTYYDIDSKTATQTEILAFLKAKELSAGEWNEISRLFEQLTEMQFSRQDIPSYDLDRMQKTLLQYVKGKIIIGNPNS